MYTFICRTRIAACFLSSLVTLALFSNAAYAIDFIAPQIEHQATKADVSAGKDHLLTAKVTDDSAVASVIVHYRPKGTKNFTPLTMQSLDGSPRYEALISSHDMATGIEYFFEASDSAGNTLEMYGSDGEPFSVAVVTQQVNVVNKINITVPNNGRAGSSVNTGAQANAGPSGSQAVLPIKKKSSSKAWLWVGLGILAAAALAGAAGGGGGSSDPAPVNPGNNTGDLDITTPVPVN